MTLATLDTPIRTLFERGFHQPGDVETRLGHHVGLLGAGTAAR